VNSFRSFQEDDEDDTHLFSKAEEYVLKNHPNPDRVGCPGPATLRAFVDAPGKVELSELNDLHILQCAECTRDLIELRRQRARELKARPVGSSLWNWRFAGIAASLCVIAFSLFILYQRGRNERAASLSSAPSIAILATVDLSGDGVERGTEISPPHAISLPSRLLNLHLLLPYYSPSGSYRIFLTKEKSVASLMASAEGIATADGPRTELTVEIDLRHVKAGSYFLGTQHHGEDPLYYYPVTIN
jgi:hypothetical protein